MLRIAEAQEDALSGGKTALFEHLKRRINIRQTNARRFQCFTAARARTRTFDDVAVQLLTHRISHNSRAGCFFS